MGLNGMTIEKELEMDIKKLNSFSTINEIREKWDMKPIEEIGDLIENSVFFQAYNQKKQAEMQQDQMGGGMFGGEGEEGEGEWNPFEEYENEEGEEGVDTDEEGGEEETEDEFQEYETEDEEKAESNIFVKAFENFLAEEENKQE